MDDDFDIPPNTKELDNALHEIHSEFIKPKEEESKANKEYLNKVMCVHVRLFWFPCDLLPFTKCILWCDH
jgi:hypothetical protein